MSREEYDRQLNALIASRMPTGQWLAALDRLEARRDYIVSGQEARDKAEAERRAAKRAARYIPARVRCEVLDSAECAYCGDVWPNHVDHVIPVSRGGTSALENLAAACRRCNEEKLDFTPDEWRGWRLSKGYEWPPKSRFAAMEALLAAELGEAAEQPATPQM